MHPVDHLMVVVEDLDDAAHAYESQLGLATVQGGRHTGLGTENRIVPLGNDYVELIAVINAVEADGNPVGRFLRHRLATEGPGLVAVCLRTDDAEAHGDRIGSTAVPMSRVGADGAELKWELVGMEGALTRGLPFWITWPLDERHPGRVTVEHPSGATGVAWVEIGGDPDEVRAWIGSDEPQLRLVGGTPGARRAALSTPAGDLLLP